MPTYRAPIIPPHDGYAITKHHRLQQQQGMAQQRYHPSDSLYWPRMEIESDEPDYLTPLSSSTSRQYVDPWDLENYAYLRRHMEPSPEPSLTTPSPAGEPISSAFYYIPGNNVSGDECRGCYAGLDEHVFYNAKYESISPEDDLAYSTYTDIETSSGDRNSSCGSTVSTLQLHTPGFGVQSGRRQLILPKPLPQLEFPGPPSHDYYEMSPDENYCSLTDCFECSINENIPLYATNRRKKKKSIVAMTDYNTCPPNHFGLSKKGLLQIDYSCNWNNLDRYIAK